MGVAVSISSGLSDVGLGVRSAAKALDLEFMPVGQEQYDLLFLPGYLESEKGQKLLEVIRSNDFRQAVERLGGYDAGGSGEILFFAIKFQSYLSLWYQGPEGIETMAKPIDFKIAVTSRGRTEIAVRIVPSFYDQVPDPSNTQVSLVIASGDTEIGGIGTPMIVGKKRFHFSFCNPAGIGRMAVLGRGFYKSKIPLRAIGVFPSWDRLVFAVHRDTGIHSLEEIKERKYPLIVSTRMLGKYRGTVLAVEEILKAYGFSLSDIEQWGGKILRVTNPGSPQRAEHITQGHANAVFDEGIKNWGSRALNSGMRFLPISDTVLNL